MATLHSCLVTLIAVQTTGQDLFLGNPRAPSHQIQSPPPNASYVKLRNGVMMPRVATSCGSADKTMETIALAWKAGMKHFLTANDYNNQQEVGEGLRALNVTRKSYFVTTMTSPCQCKQDHPHCDRNVSDATACYDLTKQELESDLKQLGMDHVDLVLLHGPNEPFNYAGACDANACVANRAQWKAYSEFMRAGKARAIGVSNFCPSCFECMLGQNMAEIPAVNQVQYHLAMGPNPSGLISYQAKHGIALQAYYPLAHAKVISDSDCVSIGGVHKRTGAQVAMRWVLQNSKAHPGTAIVTSSSSLQHLQEDLDLFNWELTQAEMARLDAKTCRDYPQYCSYVSGRPAWGCGK